MNLISKFRAAAKPVLVASAVLSLSAGIAMADFRGGATVFDPTSECGGWPPARGDIFIARYQSSEVQGYLPSSLTLSGPGGAINIGLWGAMVPSQGFTPVQMRWMFTGFFIHMGNLNTNPPGPRVRVVSRRITERLNPSGPETVENAREVVLRLRVQNFDFKAGCAVTVAATMRRFEN
jgi:hypothetical protein